MHDGLNGFAAANGFIDGGQPSMSHTHRLRDRVTAPGPLTRLSTGAQRLQGPGILPTPDPTIASCISDEDVALQLMRLGDASNFSAQGRTSTSTQDDTLSGRADIASSVSSESEDDNAADASLSRAGSFRVQIKPRNLQNGASVAKKSEEVATDDDDADYFEEENNDVKAGMAQASKRAKISTTKGVPVNGSKARLPQASKKSSKSSRNQDKSFKKAKISLLPNSNKTDMSPPTMLPPSRKTSSGTLPANANVLLVDDDLSTKPRCQRCRKSKKGCDRQRPCQRCKDAGIGIEGCISEDEGNGRKGRFGRHMGLSLKREPTSLTFAPEPEAVDATADGDVGSQEKSKKRKRV